MLEAVIERLRKDVMGKYPEVQEKARNEIDGVLYENRPGFADVAKLP